MDQSIYQGIQLFAGLSLLDFNRCHPNEPMALRTVLQDKIEVKYLAHDTAFPPGVQPACALKNGYLLLATNPEAVANFRDAISPLAKNGEAPVLRISSKELAKALRQYRLAIAEHIADQNHISKIAAAQGLDQALSVLDLLGLVEITHTGGSGQFALILRIHPAP